MEPLRYAVVTPARNEADNLRRLAACLLHQTALPEAWMIVDDASTDDTGGVADELAARHQWIHHLEPPRERKPESALRAGRRSGRDVAAFVAGIDALDTVPDVVVKVDADVSMEPGYFSDLLREFQNDATLGIASGTCLEMENGEWVPRHVTSVHVRGASRAYRWDCLEAVRPLEQRLGWDGIDELKANVDGWSTRTIPHISFQHHRAVGQRDGRWRSWQLQGEAAWYMGYRLSYLVLRSLHHARREPAAVAMVAGYVLGALRRDARYGDPEVRAYLRRYQSPRALALRAREALGHRNG